MNEEIEKITQRIEKAEAQLRKAQQQKKILEHQGEGTDTERTDAPALHQRGNPGKLFSTAGGGDG